MRYLERGRELSVAEGDVLFDVGAESAPDSIYIVLTGRIRLGRSFPDGFEMNLDIEPGGLFGLVDACTGQPRMFKAQALMPSTVYVWTTTDFENLISIYIELAEMAVQVLSRQMRFVNEATKSLR